MNETGDVKRVVEYVHDQLPSDWAQWPGGWSGEAEAALLDAVLSIGTVYGGPETGVRGAVGRWRQHRGGVPLDDLDALASITPQDLAGVLDNRQRLSGGRLKAEAIVDAAGRLVKAGMSSSADLDGGRGKYRRAYVAVRGLGTVTWDYLCMLLGVDGVKADVWIVRFVGRALSDDQGDHGPTSPGYCVLRRAAAFSSSSAAGTSHQPRPCRVGQDAAGGTGRSRLQSLADNRTASNRRPSRASALSGTGSTKPVP